MRAYLTLVTLLALALPASGIPSAWAREGRVQHLADGAQSWIARYQLVKAAKKSIHIQYFSFFTDVFGRSMMALLIDKARAGVKVQVMVDGRGTTFNRRNKYFQELVENGIEVKIYNPLISMHSSLLRSIVSNHDKILLVDNKYFITGGRNLGAKYFVRASEWDFRVFHDTDTLVELEDGDNSVLDAFNLEWNHPVALNVHHKMFGNIISREPKMRAALRALEDRMFHDTVSAQSAKDHPEVVRFRSLYENRGFQLLPNDRKYTYRVLDKSSRFGSKTELRDEIFHDVDAAREEIVIQNPYLVLTPKMEHHLQAANDRGVKIRVSVTSPSSTDSTMTQAILAMEWQHVLRKFNNCEIMAGRGPDQLHAKIFVIDHQKSIVGSYNMDAMSQDHNSEIALEVDSPEYAAMVLKPIEEYMMKDSVKYQLDPSLGPEQIQNSHDDIQRVEKLYWLASILRPLI